MNVNLMWKVVMIATVAASLLVLILVPDYEGGEAVQFDKETGFCDCPERCDCVHGLGSEYCTIREAC